VALAGGMIAALVGCGGGSDSSTTTATVTPTPPPTTTVAGPSGPAVKICDRSLGRQLAPVLSSSGFEGALRPHATGSSRHSTCELGPVELTVDNAPDAVQRYQNRIVETAQFSDSEYSRVPRTVRGVGDPDLGAAGANWIPYLRQLISARGKLVLIAEAHVAGLTDPERLALTKQVALIAWSRLD
jgi:hypothetical protein